MSSKTRIKRRRRGFATLDVLIALGILVAGALIYLSRGTQATSDSSEQQVLAQYSELSSRVRRAWMNDPDFGAVGTDLVPTIIELQAAPRDMIRTTTLENAYGGTTTVVAGANKTMVMSWPGLPRGACNALAKIEQRPLVLTINSTNITLPATTSATGAACNQSGQGQGQGNTVTITVGGNG